MVFLLTSFCEDCINQTWSTNGNQNCPVCRKPADGLKETDFDMIQKMTVRSIACSKCRKTVSDDGIFVLFDPNENAFVFYISLLLGDIVRIQTS